jgi:hypothetical protein
MHLQVSGDPGANAAIFSVICLAVGVGLYLWGWRAMRRRWTMQAMPTSKARSVAMGLAELKGLARPLTPPARLSPIKKIPCVWSQVKVVKHVQQGRSSSSYTVLDREVREPFLLEDETGKVMVMPVGADITGVELTNFTLRGFTKPPDDVMQFLTMNALPTSIGFLSNTYYTIHENAVISDATIYLLGEAATLTNITDETHRDVVTKLKSLLKDPARRAEVDTNHDGIISEDEWEAAKAKAGEEAMSEEIAKEAKEPPVPKVVVRKPKFGYFIIASGDEKAAQRAQGNPVLLIGGGIVAFVLGVCILPGAAWTNPFVWVSGGTITAVSVAVPLFRKLFRR